jgi:hypothetical protein
MRNVIVVLGLRGIRPGAHAAAGLGDGQLSFVSAMDRGQLGLNTTMAN